jgi:hypothetical protein
MYFISGTFLGILFIYFFINNSVGEPPIIKLKFDEFFINGSFFIGSRHIHHWLIFLIFLVFLIIPAYIFCPSNFIEFIAGFSLMMVFHGLSYQDSFVF